MNNEELFKFSKLFEDELTLDNLSMVQLRALCRLLGISKLGTPELLRFRLQLKLRELKADDRVRMVLGKETHQSKNPKSRDSFFKNFKAY